MFKAPKTQMLVKGLQLYLLSEKIIDSKMGKQTQILKLIRV